MTSQTNEAPEKRPVWLKVDSDGNEFKCRKVNVRGVGIVYQPIEELPHGSIKRLVGRELTWHDCAVEYKSNYIEMTNKTQP